MSELKKVLTAGVELGHQRARTLPCGRLVPCNIRWRAGPEAPMCCKANAEGRRVPATTCLTGADCTGFLRPRGWPVHQFVCWSAETVYKKEGKEGGGEGRKGGARKDRGRKNRLV
ncbi:hypothetical protein E2C01_056513 [Portunus trituberculatus]|uniref:Uncharacterized protein n=1 Tax=Portunus trituberculatus TaxID=210409 RepID=A0A5B7GZS7_PORTR|nr:hypothetical protein [Portunus trituberculatus]